MSGEHPEISALIGAATGGTAEESAAAVARLAETGLPALGPVVEALKQSPPRAEALRDAVRRMGRPELVAALTGLLKENDSLLTMVAAQALGRSGDERAVEPLLDLLRDENAFYAARGQAALGLARLGASNAVSDLLDLLKKLARGKKDRESATLIRDTAIALAILGRQEGADVVIALARHRDNAVREAVVPALKHIVGRGLFSVLQTTRRRKSTDARQEALEAIFYLGLRESIEELISYVEGGDNSAPYLIDAAVRSLRDLTGEDFKWNIDPSELREWWKQHQAQFSPNVCYRLGRPIDLMDFIDLLATEEVSDRERLLTELHIITGEEFGLDPFRPVEAQPEVAVRAQSWLREKADTYERGAVYKYGHRQNPEHIFDPPRARSK